MATPTTTEPRRANAAALPRLRWATQEGPLDAALGLDPARCAQVETIINRVLDAGGGVSNVLDALQAEVTDLTFEEWTGSVLLLGSLRLATRCSSLDEHEDCPGRHGRSCSWRDGGCVGTPPAP